MIWRIIKTVGRVIATITLTAKMINGIKRIWKKIT